MKFKDAMEAMVNGASVTRQPWVGSIYFKLNEGAVHSYQPKLDVYTYDENIMLSDGWLVEGNEEPMMFYDAIPFLVQGKKARMESWDAQTYIKYDYSHKGLIIFSMAQFPYQPDFASFVAEDWITVN